MMDQRRAQASAGVVAALLEVARHTDDHPEPEAARLERRLADHLAVDPETVVVGNGLAHLIELLLDVVREGGKDTVVMSRPAFPIYRRASLDRGYRVVEVPLLGYDHDAMALAAAVDARTALVVVDDPTSTSGQALSSAGRTQLLAPWRDGPVVLYDNAYGDYQPDRWTPAQMLEHAPKAVHGATFSKAYQMFALRVGYLVADPQLACKVRRRRMPYSINWPGLRAAEAALDDPGQLAANVRLCEEAKRRVYRELARHGVPYVETATNFVLVRVGERAARWARMLAIRGVAHLDADQLDMPGHLRVELPDPVRAQALVDALPDLLDHR